MKGTVKKEGNSWYYQFTVGYGVDGKRKQKKKRGFKTKKEAQQALTEALNAVNTGTYIEPSTTLYKEYLDDWFTTKKNGIGIQTANVYQNYLQSRIMPGLGNYTLSKLSAIQI